jgi:hypothetical protein
VQVYNFLVGHDARIDIEPMPTETPVSFDGGAHQLLEQPPRIQWERDFDDPGWVTTEIDAAVLWPGL